MEFGAVLEKFTINKDYREFIEAHWYHFWEWQFSDQLILEYMIRLRKKHRRLFKDGL
jgi:hypothetical protein